MSENIRDPKNWSFETKQLHIGQESPDPATDARAVPIYASSSFVFRNRHNAILQNSIEKIRKFAEMYKMKDICRDAHTRQLKIVAFLYCLNDGAGRYEHYVPCFDSILL